MCSQDVHAGSRVYNSEQRVLLLLLVDIEGSNVIYGFVAIMEKELLKFDFGFPTMIQTFASLQTQKSFK